MKIFQRLLDINIALKVTAIFLWIFCFWVWVVIICLLTWFTWLEKWWFFGELWYRVPYHWDMELFFASIFGVWAYFLWKETYKENKSNTLIMFTIYAFLFHALWIIWTSLFKDTIHLIIDSLYWFVLSMYLLLCVKYK